MNREDGSPNPSFSVKYHNFILFHQPCANYIRKWFHPPMRS